MFSPEVQKKAENILSRYPIKVNALLPMLHLAQRENNRIFELGMSAACGQTLRSATDACGRRCHFLHHV